MSRRLGTMTGSLSFLARCPPCACLAFLAPLLPASALAHASDRGHVLLLPTGHYLVGGALAVAASFIVLLFIRPEWLERLAMLRLNVGRLGGAFRVPASLLSFAALCALATAGHIGSRDPLSNPLPLTVWTLLWVGLTLVQGMFGNLWRWIDPWYGPWRVVLALLGRSPADPPPLALPRRLGMWPAVMLLGGFAWFELIYPAPDDPGRLAAAVGIYWFLTFAATLAFGHDAWSRRGEFLSVFFGMVSRLGIVEWSPDDRRVRLCLPGAKLSAVPALPASGVFFLLVALASVSFDGLSKTFFYFSFNGLNPLEYPGRTALMEINAIGFMASCAILSAAFVLSIFIGEKLARGWHGFWKAAGTLVWSLVPIAVAYHFSHYLTALLVNGQYALVALSDPFALGWDLFGASHMAVSAGIAAGSDAAWTIWNAQAAAIVGGHIMGVLAAHLLAFRLHDSVQAAALSQFPLIVLMIAYTVFGLWLLSTPTTG